MLKGREIAVGFAIASAFWVLILILNSDASAYYQICETNQYSGKESCTPHHVPYVIIWYVGYWFDKATSVITAVATAFIAAFTWTLWQSSEKQWKINRLAAIASRRAANAAKKSADVAEKILFAAHYPLITIAELELRDARLGVDKVHIHWALRNSGPGIAVVTAINVKITVIVQAGTKIERFNSEQKIEWIGAIESKESSGGHTVTTDSIVQYVKEIREGSATLLVQFDVAGLNIFKDRTNQRFPLVYDSKTSSFKRTTAAT